MLKNCPGGLEKYRGTFPDTFRKSRKKWSGTPLEPPEKTLRRCPNVLGTLLGHPRKSPKNVEKVTPTSCLLHCCNRRHVFCCNRRSVLLHRARICFSMNYFLEKDARRNSLSAGVLNNSGRLFWPPFAKSLCFSFPEACQWLARGLPEACQRLARGLPCLALPCLDLA